MGNDGNMGWSEFRSERVDVLSRASIGAQSGTT